MPPTKQRRLRHVALFIESSRVAGRGMLEGVARYNSEHNGWTIYYEPRSLESPPPSWLRGWRGDGILARVTTHQQVAALRETGLPVIDLRGALADTPFPAVLADHRSIAQLAFDHLRERGLIHFAYCGLSPDQHWHQRQQGELFRRLVEEAGFSCSIFHFQNKQEGWEEEQEQLAAWLRAQPKPLGIFACYDDRGYQVLDACRRIGLQVPEEAAVLGVDDDPILCKMAIPPMSSICLDLEQLGYLAASWLDRLMDGQPAPPQPILFQPYAVVSRRSTDTFAFDDPSINHVLRFISEHACEGIRVKDLPSVAHLSLSELERRFHRYLGRTPKAEILQVQIEQAKRLLRDTNLALKIIAHRTGFSSEQYFSNAFHRQCGICPSAYRSRPIVGHRRDPHPVVKQLGHSPQADIRAVQLPLQ
jgi:LacI family transcriptional regulator